jgi:hypothetical protein
MHILCLDLKLICILLKKLTILSFLCFLSNSVKTAPSFGDAAMGRIAQGAKVGYLMQSLLSINKRLKILYTCKM